MGLEKQRIVFEQSKTKGPQRLLLTVLAYHANDDTGLCFPKHPTLMDETGMAESSLKRVIGQLKETGEVLVSTKRGQGRKGNYYIITLGLTEAEVRQMVDDYKKKSITFETLNWENRLKNVSEVGHYNEDNVSKVSEKSIETETLTPNNVSELSQKCLKNETTMLTEVNRNKIKQKGEQKHPPPTSAKPNGNGKISLADPEKLAGAMGRLCKVDLEIASPKMIDRVKSAIVRLLPQGATENEIEKEFWAWWLAHDWRGQKGEPPTPEQVCDMWPRFRGAKLNGSRLGQLSDDQLAAYKAMAEAEGR